MKLNDNIATDFGSLVTLAFMTFADSEDNSVNFEYYFRNQKWQTL